MLTGSRAGIGAACRLGVRSLTGALGSPQNGAGLGDGDWQALRKDHSEADRPRFPFVCVRYEHVCTYVRVHAACTVNSEVYLFNTSRKKKEIFLTVTEKFLPVLTPILLASETTFREQTGSPVPCEVS